MTPYSVKKMSFCCCLIVYAAIFKEIYSPDTFHIAALVNFVLTAGLAFAYRKSAFLFPVLFLYAYVLYSIFVGRYYIPENSPVINNVIGNEQDENALFIVLGVTVVLTLMLKDPRGFFVFDPNSKEFASRGSAFLTIIALTVAVLLNVIYLDNSQIGQRADYKPQYEYSVVFYILAFYYSRGMNASFRILVTVIALSFAFRDFYFGHRATGLQILMTSYFFIFSNFYTFKRFILVAVIGSPFMTIVAAYRSNFSIENLNFETFSALIGGQMLAFDTAYYAYVASLTFLSVREMLQMDQILIHLYNYAVSLVLIGNYGESLYQISKNFYQHSNGGILPFYLYFYLGAAAIPISAILMTSYLNLMSRLDLRKNRGFVILIFAYIFATSPRWVMYSPNPLIRGVMIFMIVALCFAVIDRALKANMYRNAERN